MKLYKSKITNELIELVGIGAGNDLFFRYLGEDFKDSFFSIDRHAVLKNYIKVENLHE